MAQYKKPRRINPVSIFFVLLGAAAVYGVVQFGPPHWRKFRVTGVLKDAAARAVLHPDLPALENETAGKVRDTGVNAEVIRVTLKKGSGQVEAVAEYVETVQHPFVNKISRISFRPTVVVQDDRAK